MPETTASAGESLQELQRRFTAHVRNPGSVGIPDGIESRRMKIYDDLIYNNIEGFLSGGFPVVRSLYRDEDWHRLVRAFIADYRCSSPYFLEISQEFLNYLMHDRTVSPVDPPFLVELAHYEWVELALDVSVQQCPEEGVDRGGDLLEGVPIVSPLVMNLRYRYPVHQIGPGREPDAPPAEPTFLIVYRNRDDRVRFMESNAATSRLLELLTANGSGPEQERGGASGRDVLAQLAAELHADAVTSIVDYGARLLEEFRRQDIVAGTRLAAR